MKIWTEKYRPVAFSELCGQKEIIRSVESLVKQKNIPNLLFAGPTGVGKSTLALIVARSLFGDNLNECFLELNASDERGIDIVRGVIKDFSRTKTLLNVPFKIIFLDECDSLTKDAQNALRRTMETFTNNVRFILSANYSSKIIDPIQSRCIVFRFKPLTPEDIISVITKIAKQETLHLESKAIEAIYELSNGDVRRVINILQSAAAIDKTITEKLVYNLISAARPKEINETLMLAVQGDFLNARHKLLDLMLQYGFSGLDAIQQIQKEVLKLNVPDHVKVKMIERCGEIEFRIVEGSDEYLQLESLLASFSLIGKNDGTLG